jgi:hypothetical protein
VREEAHIIARWTGKEVAMKTSSRLPLLPVLICLCTLALPAWSAEAPAGACGAPMSRVASEAPPLASLVPLVPEDVPFAHHSPLMPQEPVSRAIIGDCCPAGGATQCPCVSGYSVRCGGPQCETGAWSCLYSVSPGRTCP